MLSRETVLRNWIKLAACDCADVYTTRHVTWTKVVLGNSSPKPGETGNGVKCVPGNALNNQKCLITLYIHGLGLCLDMVRNP